MKAKKIVSTDLNKPGKPLVPKYGGIVIVFGFVIASLISLQLQSASLNHTLMLAAICSTIIIALLGILDDVLDIPDRYRVIIPVFAALPLMVVKAGNSTMNFIFFTVNFDLGVHVLPLLGPVSLNLYTLLLVPIGVVACSNLVNLLAGFNGLEGGVGAVASLFIALAAVILHSWGYPGTVEASFLMFALFGACAAFLAFNWYPAKMFPGNAATYLIGAAIVSAVVIGNMERVGVIALTPQIIEFLLKARSGFRAENFGTPDLKGRLRYDGEIYSLTHLLMKKFNPTEPQLTGMLLLIQVFFGVLALLSIFIA
jgi:UDP-N-acetylglucosamine--dolichyl-phosphate N-acetylglucosaminephosphotransferase